MELDEYAACDACELGGLISSKQVSAAEVLDAGRRAIEQVEPRLNALSHGPFDDVASAVDGPFAGVPLVVKDTLFEARRPNTLGSRLLDGFVSPIDATVAVRLRDAGFVSLGRSATPEFAFNLDTAPVTNGPTRNPWSLDRSPGGSSGGSAALVAAGAVPIAHGNDGGGSIRLPAGWCGLVGLKPTRGRVPVGPVVSELVSGHGHEFVLTRSVRDAAALLDVLNGPEPGDRYYIERPSRAFAEQVGADPGRLRIAVCTTSPWGRATEPEVRAAVERTARELERLGHDVEEAIAPIDADALHDAHLVLWSWTLAGIAEAFGSILRREVGIDTVEAASLACIEHGGALSALDISHAQATLNTLSRAWGGFLDRFDVFVSPTAPTGPPRCGQPDQNDDRYSTAEAWIAEVFDWIPYTPIANATGQPSISLPLGTGQEGMPIGVMFTAQSLREGVLIRLASQLDFARANTKPTVNVA